MNDAMTSARARAARIARQYATGLMTHDEWAAEGAVILLSVRPDRDWDRAFEVLGGLGATAVVVHLAPEPLAIALERAVGTMLA